MRISQMETVFNHVIKKYKYTVQGNEINLKGNFPSNDTNFQGEFTLLLLELFYGDFA